MTESVALFANRSRIGPDGDSSEQSGRGIGMEELLVAASASAATAASAKETLFDLPGLKFQLSIGPALSGAPFHHHGPAFNLLIFGRKQWTLLPPGSYYFSVNTFLIIGSAMLTGRDVYSNLHPLEWALQGVANLLTVV